MESLNSCCFRFCNGFNWADALRISVAKTVPLQFANYAYGGATACANPTYEKLYPFVKNLTSQVAAFAEDIQKNKIRLANTSTLALQYIGSEDVMFFFRSAAEANATVTPEALAALVSRVVTCRVQGTAALAAIPGVTSIGILPISPLHLAPAVPEVMKPQLLAVQALFANATAAAMADLNAQLAAAGSTVKVYVLGPSSWIANVVNRIYPSFAFLDEPCFWYPGSMLNLTAAAGMRSCKAPQNFLFYDQLHPTTRFHDWFATKTLLPRLQTLGLLP
ncbi:hypothetical protein PLESTB_001003900 [Pleodorina starrii]|uniref:Uncharacterized protein n=1 Tax=Pleodorina starrii TaxID=330485 RepID=A0A9W6F3Z2_9CHLO|nr:hypothetical protein PLESTM_001203500 [Pleodorina starrii]GLC55587.1 hypothetical protein PLESTB_001003900 [Pleodorina starrii]GLC65338.1 hypothetical protein PLESTF_000282400 [Pleodorina starrii]